MPFRTLLAATMLLLTGIGVASAADTAGTPAADSLEALTARLQRLETRVQQLEQGCAPQAAAALPTVTPNAAPAAVTALPGTAPLAVSAETLQARWQQITAGLSPEQVRQQLGPPQQQLRIDGKPLWYYRYPGIGAGSVMFDANDQVIGSQAPPFHW